MHFTQFLYFGNLKLTHFFCSINPLIFVYILSVKYKNIIICATTQWAWRCKHSHYGWQNINTILAKALPENISDTDTFCLWRHPTQKSTSAGQSLVQGSNNCWKTNRRSGTNISSHIESLGCKKVSLTKLLNLDFLLNKICQSSSKPVDSFPLCFFKGCDYCSILVGSALLCTLLLVFFIGPSRPPGHFFLTVFFRVFCVFNIKTRGTSQIFALTAFSPILHSRLKMS